MFVKKSLDKKPGCAAEITPMAPSFATAPAKEDKLMPTPIPPCIIGIGIVKSPIWSGFSFINVTLLFTKPLLILK